MRLGSPGSRRTECLHGEQSREARPGHGRQMPRKPQGVLRELDTTEQPRQVGPAKEANEDVALAQIGMGCRKKHCKGSSEKEK